MANVFKYLTGSPSRRALKKGNLARGIGGQDYGPSSSTGYYAGITPPEGSYLITTLRGDNTPDYRVANTDEELVVIANELGGNVFHSLDAKSYLLNRTNTWLINNTPKNQTTEGLVVSIDASDISSYTDNEPTVNSARTDGWNSRWNNSGTAVWNSNDQNVPRLHPDVPVISMEKTSNGNSHHGVGYTTAISEGNTYTYSLYVWIPETNSSAMAGSPPYFRPFPANYGVVTLAYNGSTSWGTWPRGRWIRVEATGVPNSRNGNGVTNAYISSYLNTLGDKVYYTCPQFEETNNATPYIKGTRTPISTWYDLSGQNNNASLSNSPTYNTGGYITFDGTNDFATISSDSSFTVNAKTVEITFKMEGSVPNFAPLAIYANGSSSTNRIWLGIQNSKFQMHGWGTDDPTATTTIAADTWYTCVFSYDKSSQQMKMYTNGVLEKTQTNTQSGVTATTGMNWYLAHVPGGWNNQTYANISIKSFKVYNRVLSDKEVADNYHKGGITTDNLVALFDPGDLKSFSPSGETTVYSLVGNSTGTVYGAEYSSIYGGVWNFDGSNDYVEINSVASLIDNSNFTLSAWVRGGTQDHKGVIGVNTSGGGNRALFLIRNASMGIYDGGTWYIGNIDVDNSEWHHVVLSYDRTTKKAMIYVDGKVSLNATTNNQITIASTDKISIGQEWDGGSTSDHFNGQISLVSFYDKALSESEVLENYNAHRSRFGS